MHYSTDYVFDGTVATYTEEEPLAPLGVYGQSKAAGDLAVGTASRHYLIRTSWVIGEGRNFVRTMQQLAVDGIAVGEGGEPASGIVFEPGAPDEGRLGCVRVAADFPPATARIVLEFDMDRVDPGPLPRPA